MNLKRSASLTLGLAAALTIGPLTVFAADLTPSSAEDVSLRHEVQHAIDKGLGWLAQTQNTNGYWSAPEHPAVTALALTAFMGDPSERARTNAVVPKGYKFLLAHVQPNGGIYEKDLANYNTSISMMALIVAHNREYDPILRRARQWVIAEQSEVSDTNSPFFGGLGYGGDKLHHSDLNNTLVALEALYYSRYLDQDKATAGAKDLNWGAAVQFIQNCQNLPGTN